MNNYRVTVDYQTEYDAGCASYIIEAGDEDEAYELAKARALADKRRNIMKIIGGDCALMTVR